MSVPPPQEHKQVIQVSIMVNNIDEIIDDKYGKMPGTLLRETFCGLVKKSSTNTLQN